MKLTKKGMVSRMLTDVPLPKMFHASQVFGRPIIQETEIHAKVFSELSQPHIANRIQPGMQVAITSGSRGIRNADVITKAIVDFVKSRSAKPFLVPAMGSHGGATAEGQAAVLKSYGITEDTMGCPIRSSMETIELGFSENGRRVVIDKNANDADGIIVFNRIKPHNAFRGPYESGICKMLSVGLGKQPGAELVHSDGMDIIHENIPAMAKVVLDTARILFAIPCIENAYDETCRIEAIPAENILEREPELLKYAFENMGRLIVGECDVLAVHEIGKNYSGTGVDPNITGTFSTNVAAGGIKVKRTCFLNLSPQSDGNALGVGLADVITEKIFNEIDTEKLYLNCLTSTVLRSAYIPCVVSTDKEAIQFCIRTCNRSDNNNIRLVYIPNSLHIDAIMLSEAYYDDVKCGKYPGLKALNDPFELQFDKEGTIITQFMLEEDIRG